MPIVSKDQQGFMFAHQNDSGPTGKAARDFIAAGPAGGSYSKLPQQVEKTAKQTNNVAGNAVKHSFNSLFKGKRKK